MRGASFRMQSTTPSSAGKLTFDSLVDSGVFVMNHLVPAGECSHDGLMFETYGPEFDHVAEVARVHPARVATLVEGASGNHCLVRGLAFVDRLGYFVAKEDLPEFTELLVVDFAAEGLG
jgi:hypothetical protein